MHQIIVRKTCDKSTVSIERELYVDDVLKVKRTSKRNVEMMVECVK